MLGFVDDFGRAVNSSIMVGVSRSHGGGSGNICGKEEKFDRDGDMPPGREERKTRRQ